MTSEAVSADIVWGEPVRRGSQRKKNLSSGRVTGIVSSSEESLSPISKCVFLYKCKMAIHVSHHGLGAYNTLEFLKKYQVLFSLNIKYILKNSNGTHLSVIFLFIV